MTTQQVNFCTTQYIPSCQGIYPREVILCVPEVLTATGSPFLVGTLTNIQKAGNACSCVYKYTLEYDDTLLADPTTPLTPAEVSGIFCTDCLTTWVEELTVGASCIDVEDTATLDLTIEAGDPCSVISGNVNISLDDGNIIESRDDGLFAEGGSASLTGWSTDEEGDFNQELDFEGDIVYRSPTFGIEGIDPTTGSINFPSNGDLNLLSGTIPGSAVFLNAPNATGAIEFAVNSLLGWSIDSSFNLLQNATNGGNIIMNAAGKAIQILNGATLDADVTAGSPTSRTVQYLGSNAAGTNIAMIANGVNTSPNGLYAFKTRAAAGSWNANTIVSNNDNIFEIVAWGADGANYILCGALQFKVDGAPALGSMPGRIEALTSDGTALRSRWQFNTSGQFLQNATYGSDIVFTKATTAIQLQSGANGRTGTFTLNGSTPVTVNNTSLAAGDQIIITRDTIGGTPGVWNLTARTNGTSFQVTGTASDTSGMRYTLIRIN